MATFQVCTGQRAGWEQDRAQERSRHAAPSRRALARPGAVPSPGPRSRQVHFDQAMGVWDHRKQRAGGCGVEFESGDSLAG